MKPSIKAELISITHTFLAVLGAAVMSNINQIDPANLSRDALIAFSIAVFRSAIKSVYTMYVEPV